MLRRNHVHRELLRRLGGLLHVGNGERSWPVSDEDEGQRVPANAIDVVSELTEEFGQGALLESGIAELDGEARLTLSPRFATGAVLLLSDAADGLPFDGLLADGVLLGDETPAYVVAHDYRVVADLGATNGLLLLVPTIDDVVICRALGLAAVPIAGLERLGLAAIRQIAELTSTPPQALLPAASNPPAAGETTPAGASSTPGPQGSEEPEAAVRQEAVPGQGAAEDRSPDAGFDSINSCHTAMGSVELIVAGWSFVRQQRVPGELMQRAVARLADAQRFLPTDLSGVAVWLPKQTDIERLQFCWELRDREAVGTTVLESVADACYSLSAIMSNEIDPWRTPSTFLEARSALWRSLEDAEIAPGGDRESIARFANFLQRQLIDPLLEAGVNDPDPILGALRIEFANISSLLQLQAPFVQHDLIQAGVHAESRDRRGTLESSIRLRLQLLDRLARIARELRR